MSLLKKIIDLILYSNLWIGLAAALLYLQTQYQHLGYFSITKGASFVFFSTIWLYSLHRIIGLNRVSDASENKRFKSIASIKTFIYLSSGICLIVSLVLFIQLSRQIQVYLIFPALVSILYVLPVFTQRRRLRDLGIVKIFLIALIWSWTTVLIPFLELGQQAGFESWPLLLERFLFILAITIPFDVRDLEIDKITNVKTIPSLIGKTSSIRLSMLLLLGVLLLISFIDLRQMTSGEYILGLQLSYVLTLLIIWLSRDKKTDYYFTGLLDGSMIFQAMITAFLILR